MTIKRRAPPKPIPNDKVCPSAAPPNALRMWTDGTRIYVELPGSTGKPPYITAYLYSDAGLSKALNLLGHRRADYDYVGTIPKAYRHDIPLATSRSATVEKLLRQKGIIK